MNIIEPSTCFCRQFGKPASNEHFYGHLYKKKLCDVTEPPAFRVPGDMYNQEGEDEEPEWVTTERQQFTEFRDQNKDGKMDKHETRDWILPKDYDHAEAEAKHLIYEADKDEV